MSTSLGDSFDHRSNGCEDGNCNGGDNYHSQYLPTPLSARGYLELGVGL